MENFNSHLKQVTKTTPTILVKRLLPHPFQFRSCSSLQAMISQTHPPPFHHPASSSPFPLSLPIVRTQPASNIVVKSSEKIYDNGIKHG